MDKTTKCPAVAQGDLLVFTKDGTWNLCRIDYSVTRRWLSIARGTTQEQLDAALEKAEAGATKVKAAELKPAEEPAAEKPAPKPKAKKEPKAKKPAAPRKGKTKRAGRDPAPAAEPAAADAPATA